MYIMIRKLTQSEKGLILAAGFLIFISRCLLIYFMDGPFVYADEMGYWSHAANMAGLQWSIDGTSWYSYGYSLFLVPLFWISHNMYIVYKLALLLNAIASVISFLICYDISKRLSPDISHHVLVAISVMVIMYPSFLAQSYIAWSETILYLFIWILFWLMIRFEENQSIVLSFLIGFFLGFIYLIHNRTIGILIAYCMVGLVWSFVKRINWKYYIISIVVMVIILMGSGWLKRLVTVKYVKNFEDAVISGNGMASVFEKLQTFTPIEAIKTLFLSVSGQVWYLLAATGLLIFWGIVICVSQIKNRKKSFFHGFAILALAGTMGISGIWWMNFSNISTQETVRVDGLFYGRYNECVLGIFLLLGLLYLAQMQIEKKKMLLFILGSVILFMTGLILFGQMERIEKFYVQSCSVFALEYYRWLGQFNAIMCTGIAFVLALILFLGMSNRKSGFGEKYFVKIVICCICIFFWGLTGLQGTRSFTMVEQRFTKQYNELFDYVRDLQVDRVYVYGSYKVAADIQTRITDSEVIRVNNECMEIEENGYLVLGNEAARQLDLSEFESCFEALNYTVYRKVAE